MTIINRNSPSFMSSFGKKQLPNNVLQAINTMKNARAMCNGDTNRLMSQIVANNPQFAQFVQGTQGQNLENVVKSLCMQKGIDFDEFMKAIK